MSFIVAERPASSDCPTAAELTDAYVREAPTNAAPVRVVVAYSRNAGGYRASVTASGGATGARTLDSADASCAALTNALVAASALMVDQAAPPRESPPAAPSMLAPVVRAERPKDAAPESEAGVSLEVGGGVAANVLPSAGPTVYAAVAWSGRGPFAVGAEGWFVSPQTIDYAPGRIRIWTAAVDAVLCASSGTEAARWRASLCAGPAVGIVHGTGEGYASNGAQTRPWAALVGGPRLIGPISGAWRWSARAEPLLLIDRQSFSIDGLGVGYSPHSVGLRLAVGVQAPIW